MTGAERESCFVSEADLEAAFLHENLEAFYSIVGDDLYLVAGKPPHQSITFPSKSAFDLSVIRVSEAITEGSGAILIGGKIIAHSLLSVAEWFCGCHLDEAEESGLADALGRLQSWLDRVVDFSFWTGSEQLTFALSRRETIRFGGNIKKHNLLRLHAVVEKLQRLCHAAGLSKLSRGETLSIIKPFMAEVDSRLEYHSSYLVEMLHDYFMAVWRVARKRYRATPTNKTWEMAYPPGLTSEAARDLYFDAVRQGSWGMERIMARRPSTTEFLKMRY
jgi:hypothetical protein